MKWPKHVLMVDPEFFDVKYSINAHMIDKSGELNKVDRSLAVEQWNVLKQTFTDLGLDVQIIDGHKDLPDMVFTANQTFPFVENGSTQIVLSKMNSEERSKEVSHFKNWALKNNFESYTLKTNESFEGMGDALWNYEAKEVYGGFGFRTSSKIYDELEQLIKTPVIKLKLINEEFYHLDTCLAIANKDTAFAVKEGFDKESFQKLEDKFKNLIVIPYEEAKNGFAANLCCVNGTDIIIEKGNAYTKSMAEKFGFNVHEVETSEYMKSGGSVFCMKQLFW